MTDTNAACPVCGAPLEADDRFCPVCGTQLAGVIVPVAALTTDPSMPSLDFWPSSEPLLGLQIDYPERLSRWKIFFKWIFALPHLFILALLSMAVNVGVWIVWFVILFTKKYPVGLFDLMLTYMRWVANVNAYIMFQRDEYPPFGPGPYPVHLDLAYPVELSRWLIFVKWLLVIPNLFVYFFVALILMPVIFIAWWAILITGRMPRGLFDFITGANRWGYRINAYTWYMTDKYPPFSLD